MRNRKRKEKSWENRIRIIIRKNEEAPDEGAGSQYRPTYQKLTGVSLRSIPIMRRYVTVALRGYKDQNKPPSTSIPPSEQHQTVTLMDPRFVVPFFHLPPPHHSLALRFIITSLFSPPPSPLPFLPSPPHLPPLPFHFPLPFLPLLLLLPSSTTALTPLPGEVLFLAVSVCYGRGRGEGEHVGAPL